MISHCQSAARRAATFLGRKFRDGVERNRIAGELFIERHVPERARTVSCRGRQIDDASNSAALRRDQDRHLSQQVHPENVLGIRRIALRTGGDRGSENDRLISRGDHLLDGLPISDIALDRRQPMRVTGKVLLPRRAANARGRTASPHDRAPAARWRYSNQRSHGRRKQELSLLNPNIRRGPLTNLYEHGPQFHVNRINLHELQGIAA